jgi:hypothetical protein
MELLGDVGLLETHFGSFEDGVIAGARQLHGLRQMYQRLRKSFWMHPMVLLGDEAQVVARFGLCRDTANLDARSAHGLRRTYQRLKNHF